MYLLVLIFTVSVMAYSAEIKTSVEVGGEISTIQGADTHDSNLEDRLMKLESAVGQLKKNEHELKGKVDSLEEQIKLLEMQDAQKVSQIQSLEETIKTMNETKEILLCQDVLRTCHELWRMRDTVDRNYEVDSDDDVQPFSQQPFTFNDMDNGLKENDCCQNHTIEINIMKADIINIMGVVAHNAQTITENAHSINDNAHSIDNNTFYIVSNQVQIQTDRKQTDNNTNNIDTNKNNIDTITNNIDINKNDIVTNKNNIDTNTNDIVTNSNNIVTNTNGIDINTNNIDTNTNNIDTNINSIDTNKNNINKGDNINSIDINTNKDNIDTNRHDIATNLETIETLSNLHISQCGFRYSTDTTTGKINYDKLLTDVNSLKQGGLAIGTGVFTAPIQGTYLVTIHFNAGAGNAGYFDVYPYKNGKQLSDFKIGSSSSSDNNDEDSAGRSFTAQLEKDDTLHVEKTLMVSSIWRTTFCTTLLK